MTVKTGDAARRSSAARSGLLSTGRPVSALPVRAPSVNVAFAEFHAVADFDSGQAPVPPLVHDSPVADVQQFR